MGIPSARLVRLLFPAVAALAALAVSSPGARAAEAKQAAPAGGSTGALREYRDYPCSSDPGLRQFARFECDRDGGILLVKMHGWHGRVKTPQSDNVPDPTVRGYFVVSPEMRGRGDATGNPDCNGWELQDVIDAVQFARKAYASRILHPEIVLLSGGSGGGGNAYALLGKFPDFFTAARISSGMCDYALWYLFDAKGEFRDELAGVWESNPKGWRAWIGGTPDTNPEGYRSRGGLTTVENLLTPVVIFHGSDDVRVPALHARLWVGAAHGQGRGALVTYHELRGVGDTRDHFANESPEVRAWRTRIGEDFLRVPRRPPVLPEKGRLAIGGYVKTARFEVVLDSIDRVGWVDYDLSAGTFAVRAPTVRTALLRVRRSDGSGWDEKTVECRP